LTGDINTYTNSLEKLKDELNNPKKVTSEIDMLDKLKMGI